MSVVRLREIRQNASDLVRRAGPEVRFPPGPGRHRLYGPIHRWTEWVERAEGQLDLPDLLALAGVELHRPPAGVLRTQRVEPAAVEMCIASRGRSGLPKVTCAIAATSMPCAGITPRSSWRRRPSRIDTQRDSRRRSTGTRSKEPHEVRHWAQLRGAWRGCVLDPEVVRQCKLHLDELVSGEVVDGVADDVADVD